MKTYELTEIETGRKFVWPLNQILEEINRDHSDNYSAYDETDWLEGWNEWCEGHYFTLGCVKD